MPRAKSQEPRAEFSRENSIHLQAWPKYDPKLIKEEEVIIPVQVNGKLRFTVRIKNQESRIKEKVKEMVFKDERLKKWVTDKEEVRKVIFVLGRLVNIVVR